MAYNPKDYYFHKAKEDGFVARSAYKLQEIQKKYKIIRARDKVLDLGCAPGSWSQVVVEIIGKDGKLIGVDLTPVKLNFTQAKFLEADVFNLTSEDYDNIQFDCVLSDMAPKTTGIKLRDHAASVELCEKVVTVCEQHLKPNGHMAMKIFEGGDSKMVVEKVRKLFDRHQIYKPQSTRKSSHEIYIIGLKKKLL